MYPFLNDLLPEDFPPGILAFVNSIILCHLLALVFYVLGLAKDLLMPAQPKARPDKKD